MTNKTENIVKAIQTASMLRDELQQIHREASPCGEIVCLDLIADMAALENKINRYADAARGELSQEPYTPEQVLNNLKNIREELRDFPMSLETGPGYARYIADSIIERGITF